jgi:hypothetical protein
MQMAMMRVVPSMAFAMEDRSSGGFFTISRHLCWQSAGQDAVSWLNLRHPAPVESLATNPKKGWKKLYELAGKRLRSTGGKAAEPGGILALPSVKVC